MSRINVMQPFSAQEEIAAVAEVISSGWVAQGPRVAAFEDGLRRRPCRRDHAVATSSCTTALHLALIVAGVGPATTSSCRRSRSSPPPTPPTYVGARPVFADVDPVTGNLTAETVAAA